MEKNSIIKQYQKHYNKFRKNRGYERLKKIKNKEHKRCDIRQERCDENIIERKNSNIKMKRRQKKNVRDERLE